MSEENVNHPAHYNTGKFEVIDVIEDWNLNFCLGNALKYIARAEHKGNFEEDIRKAIWYLERQVPSNNNIVVRISGGIPNDSS